MKPDFMTTPNFITFFRILMLPLALVLFLKQSFLYSVAAFVLIVMMELSDLTDGYLARKLNKVSNIGKILDPFADHIYRLSFFMFFFIKGMIPLWMFLLCFYRDSIVLNLRIFAISNKNTIVAARKSGKIKAQFQSTCIILFALLEAIKFKIQINFLAEIYYITMFLVTIVTIWSAFDYFFGILKIKIRSFNLLYFSLSLIIFVVLVIPKLKYI